jgi:ATP/maltotriose-dependent transcriptional regulator MalT
MTPKSDELGHRDQRFDMDPVIFLEKVRPPDLRGLVRSRLEHGVADGPDSASLGLVLAPPGSGKTTFLSHVAAASAERVAWYRMGAEDDDEVALTRHLGHTLGAALGLPGVIESAAAGRVAGLVAALEDPSVRRVQLILDDLQEIAGSEAERTLERFLALRPRKVRVLLGSRRPPRFNIPRLLVSGDLQQLDGNDLRFRSWEVEELFRTVYDQPLSPESAAALTRRTGGWAAGLQLFHLVTATLNRADRERAVEADPLVPGPERAGRPERRTAKLPAALLHAGGADRRPVRRAARDLRLGVGAGRARGRAVLHDQRGRWTHLPLPPGAADPPGGGAGG